MQPEEKARQAIDQQLAQCGWLVQKAAEMNISAGLGVAVREFPLATGFADYMLDVDRKAAGVVEVKPEGHTLTGVAIQSAKYTIGLPAGLPHYHVPLPFAYESTGAVTQFTNDLDRDVVALDQTRLVVRTFRDRLFTEIFPSRTEVPKTLVFAKTDLHANIS